jgi:hypothetical protein
VKAAEKHDALVKRSVEVRFFNAQQGALKLLQKCDGHPTEHG